MKSKLSNIILALACITLCQYGYSQSDELHYQQMLKVINTTQNIEKKAESIYELTAYLKYISPQIAAKYAYKAEELINENKNSRTNIYCYLALGEINHVLKDYRLSQENLSRALQISETLKWNKIKVDIYNIFAETELSSNRKKAYQYISNAINLAKKEKHSLGEAKAYQIFGLWSLKSNPEEAIYHYKKAADIFRQNNQIEQQVFTLNLIAKTYHSYLANFTQAFQTLQQSIQISKINNLSRLEAESLIALGELYLEDNSKPEKALVNYLQAEKILNTKKLLDEPRLLSRALRGILSSCKALMLYHKKRGEKAKVSEYEAIYNPRLVLLEKTGNPDQTLLQSPNPFINTPPNNANGLVPIPEDQSSYLPFDTDSSDIVGPQLPFSPFDSLNQLIHSNRQKEQQIEVLSKENQSKEKKIHQAYQQRNIWIAILGLLLVGLGTYVSYLYSGKNRELLLQKENIDAYKERVNRQEVILREQETHIERKAEELVNAFIKLDDIRLENRLVVEMLHQEIEPHLISFFDKLNIYPSSSVLVQQTEGKLIRLIRSIYQVENRPNQLQLSLGNFSVFKLARKAWEQSNALFKEKKLNFINQIKPYYYSYCDEGLTSDVFLYLYYNAIHYAPVGSTISLDAEIFDKNGNNFIKVFITDQGPNITPDQYDTVFDKFSPKESRPLALTLPLVKRIIHNQGGEIFVSSNKVENFQFIFTLPETFNKGT